MSGGVQGFRWSRSREFGLVTEFMLPKRPCVAASVVLVDDSQIDAPKLSSSTLKIPVLLPAKNNSTVASSPDSKNPISPAVAIVLVNWNNWRDCIECIDTALALRYPNFHILVVDNDSSDNSVERIADWCNQPAVDPSWKHLSGVERSSVRPNERILARVVTADMAPLQPAPAGCRVSIIRSGGNLGFAGGCNAGIRCASPNQFEYFWLLNTDTVVHKDALSQLIARSQRDPTIGMTGSTVLYYDRPSIVQAMAGAKLRPESGESRHIGEGCSLDAIPIEPQTIEEQLTYIFGASMLVSRQLILDIGLMQEDYFLYYEEMDWAMRSQARFKFAYAPQSLIYHKSGNSSSKAMPLFTANLYYRNRIRFMSRFFPQFLGAAKRNLMDALLRATLKGHWSEARLLIRILLDAGGIAADALRNQPRAELP